MHRGSWAKFVDYRLLLLGSLLPDIIDKPIGLAFGILSRNVGHSLLFAVTFTLLLSLPLALRHVLTTPLVQRLSNPLPILSLGVWTHLILDRIWENPRVVLWPFLGWELPPDSLDLWRLLLSLGDPYILAGEAVGLFVLLSVAVRHKLYKKGKLGLFLRKGRLG